MSLTSSLQVPIISPPQPPPPGAVTLPPSSDLTRLRARFIPKQEPEEEVEEVVVTRRQWRIEESIFAPKVGVRGHN